LVLESVKTGSNKTGCDETALRPPGIAALSLEGARNFANFSASATAELLLQLSHQPFPDGHID
jgi:hypothetical protein